MLLDSHVLLWLGEDSARLGTEARRLIKQAPQVYFSVASLWEMRIKEALGRISLPIDFRERLAEAGLVELPILGAHADALSGIETPHRDPFDRMLLAQSLVEKVPFCTADSALLGLPLNVIDARR